MVALPAFGSSLSATFSAVAACFDNSRPKFDTNSYSSKHPELFFLLESKLCSLSPNIRLPLDIPRATIEPTSLGLGIFSLSRRYLKVWTSGKWLELAEFSSDDLFSLDYPVSLVYFRLV